MNDGPLKNTWQNWMQCNKVLDLSKWLTYRYGHKVFEIAVNNPLEFKNVKLQPSDYPSDLMNKQGPSASSAVGDTLQYFEAGKTNNKRYVKTKW